jgi:hypothetical protein
MGDNEHDIDCKLQSDGFCHLTQSCGCFRYIEPCGSLIWGENRSLRDCGIEDGDVIEVMTAQQGSIGVFGAYNNTPGVQYLQGASELKTSTVDDSIHLIQTLGGSLIERPVCNTQCKVLDIKQRKALIQLLDETHATKGRPEDLVMNIPEQKLIHMIGARAVKRLSDLFQDEYTLIRLRRTEGSGKCIKFHTDVSQKTMQVVLNAQSEYEGGRLVYATSEGFVQPQRPAGSYSIHTCKIVHGVTAVQKGVRYALFFLREHES